MFYHIYDEEKTKSFSRRTTMKKRIFLLSTLIGIVLMTCGCGGGGGGGGTKVTENDILYSTDYTNRDINKVYTFNETVLDTTDGKNSTTTHTLTYRYAQETEIPDKYGYSGTIAGPYSVEIINVDGEDLISTYISSNSIIISDDSTFFTSIDDSSSTGTIPPDWTVGTVYSKSSTEDLFYTPTGVNVGTKETEYTLKALGKENITVAAGTFEAIKTEESSIITITTSSSTEVIHSTWSFWYGKGCGIVKKVTNTSDVITTDSSTQTLTNTTTDELYDVSP
jgi:hypothetical protein